MSDPGDRYRVERWRSGRSQGIPLPAPRVHSNVSEVRTEQGRPDRARARVRGPGRLARRHRRRAEPRLPAAPDAVGDGRRAARAGRRRRDPGRRRGGARAAGPLGGRRGPAAVSVRLRWLGHASTVLDVDGVRLLTDPLLLRHAGLLRRRGAAPAPRRLAGRRRGAALPPAPRPRRARLAAAARRRPGADRAGERPLAARARASAAAVGLVGHDWWQVPGSDVRRAAGARRARPPADAAPAERDARVRGRDAELVRIWFAGDTAPFAAMADLPALAGGPIDLALVPGRRLGSAAVRAGTWTPSRPRARARRRARAARSRCTGARCTRRSRDGCRRAGWTARDRRSRTPPRASRRGAACTWWSPGSSSSWRAAESTTRHGVSRAIEHLFGMVVPAGERPSLPTAPPARAGSRGRGRPGRDVGGRT